VMYRMVVVVFDRRLWGPPASMRFRLNTPPPAPTPLDPPDNAANQGPTSVTLHWSAPIDAEGDTLRYRWSLALRTDFVGATTGTTGPGTTSASVSTVGATRYYWRVEAFDGYEYSTPGGTSSFVTLATSGGMFGKVVHAGSGLLAIVRVYNVTGGLVQEGTTTANGSFVLTGLPFGVYEVRVTSPGYEPRVISNRTLDAANPVANLGDIEMTPILQTGFDWFTILFYVGIITGIAAAIAVAAVVASRRRREKPEPAPAARPGTPIQTAGPPAAPAPEVTTQVLAQDQGLAQDEEFVFECPQCGTTVDANAKSCPGCGANFE